MLNLALNTSTILVVCQNMPHVRLQSGHSPPSTSHNPVIDGMKVKWLRQDLHLCILSCIDIIAFELYNLCLCIMSFTRRRKVEIVMMKAG